VLQLLLSLGLFQPADDGSNIILLPNGNIELRARQVLQVLKACNIQVRTLAELQVMQKGQLPQNSNILIPNLLL
jgi:hypothetical protein